MLNLWAMREDVDLVVAKLYGLIINYRSSGTLGDFNNSDSDVSNLGMIMATETLSDAMVIFARS